MEEGRDRRGGEEGRNGREREEGRDRKGGEEGRGDEDGKRLRQ